MLRMLSIFAIGIALSLYGISDSSAQPGRGGPPGGGPGGAGGPPDIKRLEADLERLRDQIKETEARLARAKQAAKGEADKGKEFGKGREFGKGKDFGKGKGEAGKGKDFGKGKGEAGKGKGGPFGGGPKLDAETIKQKYEFYKKLYDESRKGEKSKSGPPSFGKGPGGFGFGKGFPFGGPMKKEAAPPTPPATGKGPGAGPSAATSRELEARISRLERQVEELRRGSSSKRRD